MAVKSHSPRARAWATAYKKLSHLNQKLEQAEEPNVRDQLERAVAAQQEVLLAMSAPTFLAVLHKMEILFEGLEGLDQESEFKLQVMTDLSNLCAEGAALIGYPSSFATARAQSTP